MIAPMAEPRLALALQGGGAFGALTWGVLDRLLDEPRLRITAASGASAGAMNAVALAHGWAGGGRAGAQQALAGFWHGVAESAAPLQGSAGGTEWLIGLSRWLTPQQWNPLDLNPLRALVRRQFDFERLRRASPLRLFVSATHVATGRVQVFTERELEAEHLLASACLPLLHHPVTIGGETFWDGGYGANPALDPLVHATDATDLLWVPLLPRTRPLPPASAESIRARLAELQFGAGVQREWQLLAAATARARGRWWALGSDRRLRRLHWHRVDTDLAAADLPAARAADASLAFLESLRDRGRALADAWLRQHGAALGRRSSLDLAAAFGG